MTPGYDLPARPLNGLRLAAVVYDLIPLLYQEDHFPLWPGPEFVRRYSPGIEPAPGLRRPARDLGVDPA